MRLSIALATAMTGTFILAQSQADYLPMTAFAVVCLAETASSQKNIYKMYLLSVFIWVIYPYIHGDMAYTAMNIVLLTINIIILNKTCHQNLQAIKWPMPRSRKPG